MAYELATSLAPFDAEEKTKAIVVIAKIQLYFSRAGAIFLKDEIAEDAVLWC